MHNKVEGMTNLEVCLIYESTTRRRLSQSFGLYRTPSLSVYYSHIPTVFEYLKLYEQAHHSHTNHRDCDIIVSQQRDEIKHHIMARRLYLTTMKHDVKRIQHTNSTNYKPLHIFIFKSLHQDTIRSKVKFRCFESIPTTGNQSQGFHVSVRYHVTSNSATDTAFLFFIIFHFYNHI